MAFFHFFLFFVVIRRNYLQKVSGALEPTQNSAKKKHFAQSEGWGGGRKLGPRF